MPADLQELRETLDAWAVAVEEHSRPVDTGRIPRDIRGASALSEKIRNVQAAALGALARCIPADVRKAMDAALAQAEAEDPTPKRAQGLGFWNLSSLDDEHALVMRVLTATGSAITSLSTPGAAPVGWPRSGEAGPMALRQRDGIEVGELVPADVVEALEAARTSIKKPLVDPEDALVTLDQAAAYARVSKRTLERMKERGELPAPYRPGGGGEAAVWKWSALRRPLMAKAKRSLPEVFPG